MICREYRDSIALLVDGELSADAADGVRAHVGGCPGCHEYHASMESLVERLRPQDAPASIDESRFWRGFEADLGLRVARGGRPRRPVWRRSVVLPFPLAAAGALGLAALCLLTVQTRRRAIELHERGLHLEAELKAIQENSIFGGRSEESLARAVPQPSTPAVVPFRPARPSPAGMGELPAGSVQPASATLGAAAGAGAGVRGWPADDARFQIRYIDSGVVQPGDHY